MAYQALGRIRSALRLAPRLRIEPHWSRSPRIYHLSSRSYRAPEKLTPTVSRWLQAHNVASPRELKTQKMAAAASRVLGVSYCARRAFRPHHMAQYFTGPEHTLTAYWLHRYEEKLREPLWIHIVGSYQVKPVVRNSSRRRLRRGIHAALAEAGYAVDGKIAQPPLGSDGASVIQTPTAPLTGTVMVTVKDALAVMEMGEEECLKVGREIVQKLKTPRPQGAKPLTQRRETRRQA